MTKKAKPKKNHIRKKAGTVLGGLLFIHVFTGLSPTGGLSQAATTDTASPSPAVATPSSAAIARTSGPVDENASLPHPSVKLEELRLDTIDPDDADNLKTSNRLEVPAFMVRRIIVEGSSLLNAEQWQPIVAPYEGREQTLAALQDAVEAIQALYREKGYPTTQVYIPPQSLEGGVLTIHVQEGTVGKVLLEGTKYYKARIEKEMPLLSQKSGALFDVHQLENALNRSNQLNEGYRIKAVLKAGEMPGQTDIHLQVAEKQPLQISPTFDNQGRPGIGLFRGGVELVNNSLSGRGDRLSSRLLTSAGAQALLLSYSLPINTKGTELQISAGYSRVSPSFSGLSSVRLLGNSGSFRVGILHPFDRDHHWVGDAGLSWQRVSSYIDNERSDLNDIRGLQVGLTYDRYDHWGRSYNRLSGMVAAGGQGGQTGSSRFFKFEDYFTRFILLPKRNMLVLKGYGQWSPNAIPMAEQFQVGGYNSVRGFTEGILMGDKGFSAGIEHRFPIPGLGKINMAWDNALQGVLFYDIGRSWMNTGGAGGGSGRVAATLGSNSAPLLQSAGVGLRAQFSRYLQGFVDVGFVLGGARNVSALSQQPRARIHLGIRTDLMPNDYRSRSNTPAPPKLLPAAANAKTARFKAAQADKAMPQAE